MADKFYITKENKKNEPARAKHNLAWILGCVVLAIIAISFIVPASGLGMFLPQQNGIVFGRFNGKKITYAQDSYMYNISEQYMNMFSGGGDYFTRYAMQTAYEESVFHEFCAQESKKSGINVSSDDINNKIIKLYVDQDGNFAKESWSRKSKNDRDKVRHLLKSDMESQVYLSNWDDIPQNQKNIDFINENFKEVENAEAVKEEETTIEVKEEDSTVSKTDVTLENNGENSSAEQALAEDSSNTSNTEQTDKEALDVDSTTEESTSDSAVYGPEDENGNVEAEQPRAVKPNMSVTPYSALKAKALSSKLHVNNFEKVYSKYFKPSK